MAAGTQDRPTLEEFTKLHALIERISIDTLKRLDAYITYVSEDLGDDPEAERLRIHIGNALDAVTKAQRREERLVASNRQLRELVRVEHEDIVELRKLFSALTKHPDARIIEAFHAVEKHIRGILRKEDDVLEGKRKR